MKDLEQLLKKLEESGFDAESIKLVENHSKHLQSKNASDREEAKQSRLKSESLQTKIDELTEKIEDSKNGGTSEEKLRLKKLEKQLEEITGRLEISEKEKIEAKKKASESKLDSLIKDELLAKGVAKKHLNSLAKLVKVEFSQDADGDFVSSDGKKISDYVGEYLTGEDHLLENTLPSGAGTRKAGDTAMLTGKLTTRKDKDDALLSEMKDVFNKG